MNKIRKKLIPCILTAAVAVAGVAAAASYPASAQETDSDFYWSEKNAPVFYGAAEITLSKNAVEKFDVHDARFRTFAHDFEDGDVAVTAVCPDINTASAGEYEIVYTAKDSHKNEVKLTVPVTVTDDENGLVTVRRTLYTTPSDWNMTAAGFSRCNSGDRQILGIYLPEGASFEMRLLEGAPNIGVAMLNNDAYKETSVTVNSTEFTKISNDYKGNDPAKGQIPGNYANVPLITTPKLARGADISTTYQIEVKYSAADTHSLQYYNYLDHDEEQFRARWQASGDKFAIIENRAMTILLPEGDREAFKRKESGFVFGGYDEHLEYYAKVVDRMDEIIGLSYRPEKATDQNLRAKYLIKANAHGAGAAYYAGNHVGINNPSMGAFYQMNWGGLHELAHGYQGHLGSGTMGLGETSNNFLGHYIQMDKTLYTEAGDWLGKLPDIEVKINELRLSGKTFNDFGETPQYKLYAIINLFDYFEGEKTYAKLFSYYREMVDKKILGSQTPQQDVYALFFAEEYQTDIIPYWTQWGLQTSEEVQEQVFDKATKTISILSDSAGESRDEIAAGEDIALKYGFVTDGQLAKYSVTGNLDVTFDIDDGSALQKGCVLLQKDGETVYSAEISQGKARFEGVAAGSYMVRTPLNFGYDYSSGLVTVAAGENDYAVTYTKRDGADFHPTKLVIRGIRGTLGFSAELKEDNKFAALVFGASDLGNQNAAWAGKPDETFISVTVTDGKGKTRCLWDVKGNGYFCYLENIQESVTLSYGDKIIVNTERPELVHVESAVDGKVIPEYDFKGSGRQSLVYTVTQDGLVPEFLDDFDVRSTLYDHIADGLKEELRAQAEFFVENPQVLGTKYLEKQKKSAFIESYERLSEQDKAEFSSLAKGIMQGGAPKVTALKSSVSAESFSDIDWNECFSAFDNEDGAITYGDKVEIVSDADGKTKGEYDVKIVVTDYDGNVGSCSLKVTVTKDTGGLADIILIAVGGALIAALVITITIIILRRKSRRK